MEKVRQVLAQDDTVLFIGSGISLWSGLPSWSKMVDELADFIDCAGGKADLIRNEARRGDLLQAASYGFSSLTKQQIGEFVRSACRYGVARPHEIHRKIVSLGPRCFVTTNYDNLLEESLRLWCPERFFRAAVTNRHLTETADIVSARAVDFVFKPHGDAGDSESIVLTREQYRQLLPGGERQAALESVKMLLASRPVVYLGFGLRDPDFLYVRDVLANIYRGASRDHYAIMPDVVDAECDFWRGNYGIHIIGYQTTEGPHGSRDHSALLTLLDGLLAEPVPGPSSTLTGDGGPCPPELILGLARHAGRLERFTANEPEFPVRVHLEEKRTPTSPRLRRPDRFDHCPVERFLDEGPERAILLGLPGAGKTYSLGRSAARLADKLREACLGETLDEENVVIPILVDLKLYDGNLRDLVEQSLPRGVLLSALATRFRLKVFLDSFNEMPREQWESGAYEADFAQFIGSLGNASIVIGSRTSDGLSKMGFPPYCLDQIDEQFVGAELQRRQFRIDGRFEREVRWLLQKPFYFQLYARGSVTFSSEPHPREFFQCFFRDLTNDFVSRFGVSFDIERALSLVAYEAINGGEEARPVSCVLEVLARQLQEARVEGIDASDVANWLVSKSVLIPYTGGRLAYFHQSITEFLAASELARRYQVNPQILSDKLRLTRWDQALFLAMSFLPREAGVAFLQSVVAVDLALALHASKYLEAGRDEIVGRLLSQIPDRVSGFWPHAHEIEHALRYGVPLSDVHEPELRAILAIGGMVGAVAALRLVELKGASVKAELLQSLFDHRNDYNYCCNGVAPAICPFIGREDLQTLVTLCDSLGGEVTPLSDGNTAHGFTSGANALLARIDLSTIRDAFMPGLESPMVPEARARILCSVLQSRHSTEALELAADLLLRGVRRAATAIYFIANFSKPMDGLRWDAFSSSHIECLIAMVPDPDEDAWALKALRCICQERSDLRMLVQSRAWKVSGLLRAALLYGAPPQDEAPIFGALSEFTAMDEAQRQREPTHVLGQISLDWAGHEMLLVRLLKLRDADLALAIIDPGPDEETFGDLEIGPIEWWLEWMMEDMAPDKGWWLRERISGLFEGHLRPEVRDSFVAEFNRPGSKYREVLAGSILLARKDLSTDNFSEDAISFLLRSLRRRGVCNPLHGHLLGNTATESFVTERLLPLLTETETPLRQNLHRALKEAGARHGRRYVMG